MTTGAIVTQIILSLTNLTLIFLGIQVGLTNKYKAGPQIAIWGAFVGFAVIQGIFLFGDLR